MLLAALVACTTPPATPIRNASPQPATPGLPCGVTTFYELDPYGPPQCEPSGSCLPGRARANVGSCTVAPSTAFDLFAGQRRSTIFDGDLPILSSDAPPYARRVVFDARVPAPTPIRVGMTGAELERMFPDDEVRCELDDLAWRGHLLCGVRKHLECDAEDANWHFVVFDGGGVFPHSAKDAAARALIRDRRIRAIDLGPDCGED